MSLLECSIVGPENEDVGMEMKILGGKGEREGESENQQDPSSSSPKAAFSYTPTTLGLHTIHLKYKGDLLFRRPVIIKPPPLHFNIFGPGLHSLQALVPTSFTVSVMDGVRGKMLPSIDDLVAEVIPPSSSPSSTPPPSLEVIKQENDDLSVIFYFTPQQEGQHKIRTEYEGVEVLNHPLIASPPPSSHDRHFVLEGVGLHGGRVGIKGTFVVTMYDKEGGVQMKPDGKLSVVVVGGKGEGEGEEGVGEGEGEGGVVIPAYVEEGGEEVSRVGYTPIQVGEHKVTVIYNGKIVVETKVMIQPPPQNLHFDIKGGGLHGAVVGEGGRFQVKVVDKGSGEVVSPLGGLEVVMKGAGGEGEGEGGEGVEVVVSEGGDFVTNVEYVVKKEGKYTLAVTYHGKKLLTKVISVTKKPSLASLLQFSLKGGGLKGGVVGEKGVFVVRATQKGGKGGVKVGEKLTCVVVGPGGEGVEVGQREGEGGGREVWWVPEVEGVHSILLKYGEKKLLDTKVVVKGKEGKKERRKKKGSEMGEKKKKKKKEEGEGGGRKKKATKGE